MEIDSLLPEAQQVDELAALRKDIMAGRIADIEKPDSEALPVSYRDIEEQLIEGMNFAEELNRKIEALKERLLAAMEENGVKQWKSEKMIITRTDACTRSTFDAKRFKAEHEDIYAAYVKLSETKPSVRITIKK